MEKFLNPVRRTKCVRTYSTKHWVKMLFVWHSIICSGPFRSWNVSLPHHWTKDGGHLRKVSRDKTYINYNHTWTLNNDVDLLESPISLTCTVWFRPLTETGVSDWKLLWAGRANQHNTVLLLSSAILLFYTFDMFSQWLIFHNPWGIK